jgi:hypothetical protein
LTTGNELLWITHELSNVPGEEQDAREGVPFIADHIIDPIEVVFDDFDSDQTVVEHNRKILGLSRWLLEKRE